MPFCPCCSPSGSSSSPPASTPPHNHNHHHHRWLLPEDVDNATEREVESCRRRLQFFFMCPVSKWRVRKQIPCKLLLQLIKVLLVTVQLSLFASRRFSFVGYMSGTQVVLEHMLLPDWDSEREVNVYPPSTGPLAVYSREQFCHTLHHVVGSYFRLDSETIAELEYPPAAVRAPGGPQVSLCLDEYRTPPGKSDWDALLLNTVPLVSHCLPLTPGLVPANTTSSGGGMETHAKELLQRHLCNGDKYKLRRVLEARLSVVLVGVERQLTSFWNIPSCYLLNATVRLDNSALYGQMVVKLVVDPSGIDCSAIVSADSERVGSDNHAALGLGNKVITLQIVFTVLNMLVIIVCLLSLCMCVRSMVRATKLRRVVAHVLRKHFHHSLTMDERCRFVQLWYVCIVINDILIVFASVLKVRLDNVREDVSLGSQTWNICSLALGIGCLLVWIGVLRYLSFFREYNVLILTVKRSIPAVLRFSVCTAIVYAGFTLCGWMILSPYHLKFRSLTKTSEALFSLMNGDDMFATFAQVSKHSPLIYWFSKLYIYLFVCSFIYLVLSLMIAIIMDTFESIKSFYQVGFPMTALDEFCRAKNFVAVASQGSSGEYPGERGDESRVDVQGGCCIRWLFSWCFCSCCGSTANSEWSERGSRSELLLAPEVGT